MDPTLDDYLVPPSLSAVLRLKIQFVVSIPIEKFLNKIIKYYIDYKIEENYKRTCIVLIYY